MKTGPEDSLRGRKGASPSQRSMGATDAESGWKHE